MITWMLSHFRDLRLRWMEGESRTTSQVLHDESARQDRQANAIRHLRKGLLEEEAGLARDERRDHPQVERRKHPR